MSFFKTHLLYLAAALAAATLCCFVAGPTHLEATTPLERRAAACVAPILVGAMVVGGYFQTLQ